MADFKTIAKLEVIKAGSNPDIDSDFRTDIRDSIIEYCSNLYGHNNVANIVTFGTLAAKSSFKDMCTIYEKPFAMANKIASLVPPPIEGVTCSLEEIFDPESARYNEAADFRAAVEGDEWKDIILGARKVEGRLKSTGVHASGIIISSKPLEQVIPLHVRQTDNRVITQWSFPECEDLGLIKFDFLGLDTVDVIQSTVEYIQKGNNSKNTPNILELIHGDMDDKKTYQLFASGDTVGIFQFSSSLVQDYCKLMKPTEFKDLVATTALLRPGPMSMQSHVRYANRKNAREKVIQIHPDFNNSPLEQIFNETYGLCVYQEQVLQISNRIAGMTLQEGDELRKAMGKKKMYVMLQMKEKFLSGGQANGYSEEALNKIWDNIAEFARYGFNKAHAVAYGMNAYATAYLKANFPVEFMAAIIAQNVDDKDKTLMYLKETRRMGLKLGSVDINLSDVRVAPDFTGQSGFDILYGLSGVNGVSTEMATLIVTERNENGAYTSIQDLINRCSTIGVNNKKIYENLALAGAFDSFGIARAAVVESLSHMIGEAKTKKSKGASLFDMFEEEEDESSIEMDLSKIPEFSFVEKLQKEAEVIGLYLTAHPLSKVGVGLSQGNVTHINKLDNVSRTTTVTVAGSLTEITKKMHRRGGKSIQVTIDDGTGYIIANLNRDLVKGIDKHIAQEKIRKAYIDGDSHVSSEVTGNAWTEFAPVKDLEKNNVYLLNITYRPAFGDAPYNARVNWVKPLELTHDGSLPIRMRIKSTENNKESNILKAKKFAESIAKKYPGDYPIYAAVFSQEDVTTFNDDTLYYFNLVEEITKTVPKESSAPKKASNEALFGKKGTETAKTAKKKTVTTEEQRKLPDFEYTKDNFRTLSEEEIAYEVKYFDTGYRAAKTAEVEELLSSKLGIERVDYGIYNSSIDENEMK